MRDSVLRTLLQDAIGRLRTDMTGRAPHMAEQTWAWLQTLGRGRPLEDYFTTEWGYPVFSLPWWVASTLAQRPTLGFHSDLVYSTVNGYLYIRLIDDLMDGDAAAHAGLLPSSAFFHSRFQEAYQRHFPSGHPFWVEWDREWLACQEASMLDHRLTAIDKTTFARVSARKTGAAKIPVVAVCHHCGRDDLIPAWTRYCDVLSCYVQMVDDLFDWPLDGRQPQRTTFFLSEAKRRCRPGESRVAWAAREGLDWALALCFGWLQELEVGARDLGCEPLRLMVTRRRSGLVTESTDLRQGLQRVARLGEFFGAG